MQVTAACAMSKRSQGLYTTRALISWKYELLPRVCTTTLHSPYSHPADTPNHWGGSTLLPHGQHCVCERTELSLHKHKPSRHACHLNMTGNVETNAAATATAHIVQLRASFAQGRRGAALASRVPWNVAKDI